MLPQYVTWQIVYEMSKKLQLQNYVNLFAVFKVA